ncbi:hypothetical protein Golax_003622 [Gossypium laxum]|uniref:RNase H type-1 domain-containing protein n=1 Tax=Gossypium laxum TaxID=34288 RepID=A0A7J9AFZ2_9ROSI|nr:hypothetical protein [Gossypium laxum]
MGECICKLPIPPIDVNDSRTWLHNPHGVYTSKFAYSWLSLKRIGFGPHRPFWRIIWKLKMLPKIKVFRIGHNILPTYANIARIHHNFSTTCPRCKNNEENLIHALKECLKVRETLIIGGLKNRLLDGNYVRCIDWLEDILRELDSKAAADFFTLLWNCWNSRNKMVFQGKDNPTMVMWERAQTLSNDFRIFNLNEPPVIPPTPVTVLNGYVGYGAIARDADGFALAGCCGFANKAIDAVWADLKALTLGLKLASNLKLSKMIMESDNATLINTIKNCDKDVTILGCCVKQECRAIRNFETVHFNWIDRNSNEVVDMLCKIAIKNRCDLMFNMDYPLKIHNVII